MPFIGNQPALSYTSFAKQDFTTSATTSYSLDHPVANANELALFINFVRQEPTTAYTASGTSLTLTSATSASDDMYCVYLGKAVQTVNPPSGSVGISQLSATGTKNSTTFLRGDNTFDTPPLGGITMANNWRLSSNVSSDATPITNWEENDSAGAGKIGSSMTLSSGLFTFPSTGIYLVTLTAAIREGTSADNLIQIDGYFNAVRMMQIFLHVNNDTDTSTGTNQVIIDVDDVSKTFYVNCVNNGNGTDLLGYTDSNQTSLVFLRLGDT